MVHDLQQLAALIRCIERRFVRPRRACLGGERDVSETAISNVIDPADLASVVKQIIAAITVNQLLHRRHKVGGVVLGCYDLACHRELTSGTSPCGVAEMQQESGMSDFA